MLEFHETLEKFFHKNFQEEIHRLSFEIPPEPATTPTLSQPYGSYAPSLTDAPSVVNSSTSITFPPLAIPPLQLPGSHITPSQSPPPTPFTSSVAQPTRLQQHIAHLARHGMNAVASGERLVLRELATGLLRERHRVHRVARSHHQWCVDHGKYQWISQKGSLLAAWDSQLCKARGVGVWAAASVDARGSAEDSIAYIFIITIIQSLWEKKFICTDLSLTSLGSLLYCHNIPSFHSRTFRLYCKYIYSIRSLSLHLARADPLYLFRAILTWFRIETLEQMEVVIPSDPN